MQNFIPCNHNSISVLSHFEYSTSTGRWTSSFTTNNIKWNCEKKYLSTIVKQVTLLHFRIFFKSWLFSSNDSNTYCLFNFDAIGFCKITDRKSVFTLYHVTKWSYHKNLYNIRMLLLILCWLQLLHETKIRSFSLINCYFLQLIN